MSDFYSTPQSFRHMNLPIQVALDIAYDFAERPGANVELHVFIDLTHATPTRCKILAQEITPEQHRLELQKWLEFQFQLNRYRRHQRVLGESQTQRQFS